MCSSDLRSFETREGEKRTVVELQVDEVGPSLAKATARVTRTPRNDGGFTAQPQPQAAPTDDPWATHQPTDAPPF